MTMVMAMAIPAMAASITINSQKKDGEADTTKYTYYEIFKADIGTAASEGEDAPVSYYIPVSTEGTALKDAIVAADDATDPIFTFTTSADGTKYVVTAKKGATATDVLDVLNTTDVKKAALAHNDFSVDASTGKATASNLDQGYYLVTSNLGTKAVLQTLGEETINAKDEYPGLKKEASTTNLSVGDKVTYTITVSVPASATVGDTITVHDTLAEQLKIDTNTIAAKLGEDTVTLTDATAKTGETFAKSFTITNDMLGKDVVITYQAELLSSAANDEGYVNSAYLDYNNFETKPSTVDVKTYDFDLTKTFSGSTDATYSATFELRTDKEKANTAIEFVYDSTKDVYTKADSDDEGSTTITAKNNDQIKVSGLAQGTYYLVETGTHDGYNALTEAITVTIDKDGNASFSGENSAATTGQDSAVTVTNNKGTELPSTGGMGTTIFYVLGAALVIGAGVVLVTRRRLSR